MSEITTSEWIAIAATIIPSIISIIIGVWQIKVMRELANATNTGQEKREIKPPKRRLRKTLFRIGLFVFGVCLPIVSLFLIMYSSNPLSKSVVLLIAIFTGSIFFNILLLLFDLAMDWTLFTFENMVYSYGGSFKLITEEMKHMATNFKKAINKIIKMHRAP